MFRIKHKKAVGAVLMAIPLGVLLIGLVHHNPMAEIVGIILSTVALLGMLVLGAIMFYEGATQTRLA